MHIAHIIHYPLAYEKYNPLLLTSTKEPAQMPPSSPLFWFFITAIRLFKSVHLLFQHSLLPGYTLSPRYLAMHPFFVQHTPPPPSHNLHFLQLAQLSLHHYFFWQTQLVITYPKYLNLRMRDNVSVSTHLCSTAYTFFLKLVRSPNNHYPDRHHTSWFKAPAQPEHQTVCIPSHLSL